jgi:hypothetical protein
MSAKLLALLSPRGIEIGRVPGASGAAKLTAHDVAAALGMGHDPMGAELLLAKFSGDHGSIRSAKIRWRMAVGDRSISQKWGREPKGTTFALADWTLNEFLSSNRCTSCHGVAELLINNVKKSCPACHGTGLTDPSEHAISRSLGLPVADYRAHWSVRLGWCRRELQRIEYEALIALDEALED